MNENNERNRNIEMPNNRHEYYTEKIPLPEYHHASEIAHESFRDMKFGVRIHWGLYSILQLPEGRESWPFLTMTYQKRQEWQELYKKWNPVGFNAEEWMTFFERAGFKCFAITTKHHEGFSLFDTHTRVKQRINWIQKGGPIIEPCDLAFSTMDTPFKRDIIKELCNAAHQHKIKIDLYFSHPDWYDADFRPYSHHPVLSWKAIFHLKLYDAYLIELSRKRPIMKHPTSEEGQRMMERHRQQLIELLSNYGKIDMCCLDMRLGPENWAYLRETILLLRKIQPDVMFRNRGIGNYGDYYTPERVIPGNPSNTNMPWMVIYPLGKSFSYEPNAKMHKGTKWIVHKLVDTVAKGGNFMVGIGPNSNGKFHPEAIKQLEAAGTWLKVNGEGIYSTRMWTQWREGINKRFTVSKDKKTVYLFVLSWPGTELRSKFVRPKEGSDIFLFGVKDPLKWCIDNHELVIKVPDLGAKQKPCDYAWGFKIQQ